jgi:hypothetical protein
MDWNVGGATRRLPLKLKDSLRLERKIRGVCTEKVGRDI